MDALITEKLISKEAARIFKEGSTDKKILPKSETKQIDVDYVGVRIKASDLELSLDDFSRKFIAPLVKVFLGLPEPIEFGTFKIDKDVVFLVGQQIGFRAILCSDPANDTEHGGLLMKLEAGYD